MFHRLAQPFVLEKGIMQMIWSYDHTRMALKLVKSMGYKLTGKNSYDQMKGNEIYGKTTKENR